MHLPVDPTPRDWREVATFLAPVRRSESIAFAPSNERSALARPQVRPEVLPRRIHRAVGGQHADGLPFTRRLNGDRSAGDSWFGERERVTDATANRGCVAQRAREPRPLARRSRGRTAASRASSLRSSPEAPLDLTVRSAGPRQARRREHHPSPARVCGRAAQAFRRQPPCGPGASPSRRPPDDELPRRSRRTIPSAS
jgi:hypothetical protein